MVGQPASDHRVRVRATDRWARVVPIAGIALLLVLAGCSEGGEEAESGGTTQQSGAATDTTAASAEATTTEVPVSTTLAPVSTTLAPVSTTEVPVSTTEVPVSTTVAPVTTTLEAATTTVELVTTTVPPVAWPTVFSAWVGGGDPGADCGTAWDFLGFQPVGPFIGTGWGGDQWQKGHDLQLCFAGFNPAQAIELVIIRPDGSVATVIAHSGDVSNIGVSELIAPGVGTDITLGTNYGFVGTTVEYLDPELDSGSYSILASQGALAALVEFEVVVGELGNPERAYINPLDGFESPATLEPGDMATVLLLGFPPETTVPLAVYRNTGGFDNGEVDFEFLQLLANVATNVEGWAFFTFEVPELEALPTGKGTPQIIEPQYCIVSTPDLIDFDCQPGFTPGFNQP